MILVGLENHVCHILLIWVPLLVPLSSLLFLFVYNTYAYIYISITINVLEMHLRIKFRFRFQSRQLYINRSCS